MLVGSSEVFGGEGVPAGARMAVARSDTARVAARSRMADCILAKLRAFRSRPYVDIVPHAVVLIREIAATGQGPGRPALIRRELGGDG